MALQYNGCDWPQHPDGNREIRSMAIAALPIPPLPLMVCQEIEGENSFVSSQHKFCSSHDLIAHLMNVTCAVASASVNQKRMEDQSLVLQGMFDRVDAHVSAGIPSEEWCYDALCDCTRQYVGTYVQKKCLDLRFAPASEIGRDHAVFRKIIDFQQAHDILYGPLDLQGKSYKDMTYAKLVQLSVQRIVSANTCSLE